MTDASQNPADNQPQADDMDLQASATDATTDSAAPAAGEEGNTAETSAVEQAADAAEELSVEDTLLEKVQELTEDLQRVTAEFANYRKRVERELGVARDNGKAGVLNALLALADDVERARQHGDITDGSPLKAFTDKFSTILSGQGVEQFGETGDVFDANHHSAIQDEGGDGEKVLSVVLRKGFRLGDRVLREAMVIVRGDADDTAASSDGAEAGTAEATDEAQAEQANS